MKTLQDCKDAAADNWFLNSHGISGDFRTISNGVKVGNIKQRSLESVMDEAAERYASQFREPSSPSLQSEPVEQQKTAEQILRKHVELGSIKRGDGPIPDEEWADVDDDMKAIATDAMEEYAALRSEQLRKEIEELKNEKKR